MSMSKRLTQNYGTVNLNQINVSPKSTVTQTTNLGTAVTINAPVGFINTVSTSLATQGSTSFTCSNNNVGTSNIILANVQGYTGTGGSPSVYVSNVGSGRFTLTVQNRDLVNALGGSIKVGFLVL